MTTDTPDAAPAAQKPTIVLIHGLWLTPLSWEGWRRRFESKGYTVLAPAWPGFEGTVEEVRQNTSRYERLGIKEITDHYDGIIRRLDAPPIIMGHSFGGLIAQLLLDRGLGASAVAISPAQIKGVYILPLAQAKVASVALKSPANLRKTQMLTPEEFHYGFTNTLTLEESKPIYDRLAVPGPGRTLFQAAFANFTPHAVTTVNRHNSSRAAAVPRQRKGPHRARRVDARRLQDPEEDGRAHRDQGVPRPVPLHLLPGRLGRGGRLLARLGRAQRANLTRRPADDISRRDAN
jgi:pimeloyl-ACP methyl ester carboxylesterase